jgi:hypothetical protein
VVMTSVTVTDGTPSSPAPSPSASSAVPTVNPSVSERPQP